VSALQSFMGSPSRPDVDALHNLSAAIVVDQERMAEGPTGQHLREYVAEPAKIVVA